LSIEDKVSLVSKVKQEYGLNMALRAIDLPKSTWYYQKNNKRSYEEKYEHLKPTIEEIINKHHEYGYPRIKVELEEEYKRIVNHKVLLKLLNIWDLKMLRTIRPKERSTVRKVIEEAGSNANLVKKKKDIGLFEVTYTDFTKVPYDGGKREAWLIPIIGHTSKIILGWAVGKSANTELALKALERMEKTLNRFNIALKGMILHQDKGSVFTSNIWIDKVLRRNKIRLSYSENGARGNTEMESFNGHFKCPNLSLFYEAKDLTELRAVIRERVKYWNIERRHSTLDYKAPLVYLKNRGLNVN
jgi:putative transposase